jgi:hypothetical protein
MVQTYNVSVWRVLIPELYENQKLQLFSKHRTGAHFAAGKCAQVRTFASMWIAYQVHFGVHRHCLIFHFIIRAVSASPGCF